jgi:hypothetical protein
MAKIKLILACLTAEKKQGTNICSIAKFREETNTLSMAA